MNKKINTILFIICATLFNVLVSVLFIAAFTFLYLRFFIPVVPENGRAWGFTFIFLTAIAISFYIYRFVMKFLMKKIDAEMYFNPVFTAFRF